MNSEDTSENLPGYSDPGENISRGADRIIAVMIAVAIGADTVMFFSVLSLILPALPISLVWLVVAGFTACSVSLAALVGRLARDRVAGFGQVHPGLTTGLSAVWLLLGLSAFATRIALLRFDVGPYSIAPEGYIGSDLAAAVLFLMLYVGSGFALGAAAYVARNPLGSRFRKATRGYRLAMRRLGRSQAPYERAVSVLEQRLGASVREADTYAATRQLRVAYAEEAKAYARILIAENQQAWSSSLPRPTPAAARPSVR